VPREFGMVPLTSPGLSALDEIAGDAQGDGVDGRSRATTFPKCSSVAWWTLRWVVDGLTRDLLSNRGEGAEDAMLARTGPETLVFVSLTFGQRHRISFSIRPAPLVRAASPTTDADIADSKKGVWFR